MKTPSLSTSKVAELRDLDQDGDVLLEIVNLFFTTFEARCTELKTALAAGDLRRVGAIAHELRSSSGNLGAEALAQLAGDLERLPQVHGAGHPGLVNQLEHEFTVVRNLLTQEIGKT